MGFKDTLIRAGYNESETTAAVLTESAAMRAAGYTQEEINKELGIPTNPNLILHNNYESIIPIGDTGFSESMQFGNKTGVINWDIPPVNDNTSPFPRYTLQADDGTYSTVQLATEAQGGQWAGFSNAESSYNKYMGWSQEERSLQLDQIWSHNPEVGEFLEEAISQKMPWENAKERLLMMDTYRQIHSSDYDEVEDKETLFTPADTPAVPQGFEKVRLDLVEWDFENDQPIYSDTPQYELLPAGTEDNVLEESRKWARLNQYGFDQETGEIILPPDMEVPEWGYLEAIEKGAEQSVTAMSIKLHSCQLDRSSCPTSFEDLLGDTLYLEEQPFLQKVLYQVASIFPDSPIFFGGCKIGGAVAGAVGSAAGPQGAAAAGAVGCFAGMFGIHGAIRSVYDNLLNEVAGVTDEQTFFKLLGDAVHEFGSEAVIGALTGYAGHTVRTAMLASSNPLVKRLVSSTTGASGKAYGVNTAKLLTEAAVMTEAGITVKPMLHGEMPQKWWPTAEEYMNVVATLGVLHTTNTGIGKMYHGSKGYIGSRPWAVEMRLRKMFKKHGIHPKVFNEWMKEHPDLRETIVTQMQKAPRIRGGKYYFDLPEVLVKSIDTLILHAQKAHSTQQIKDGIIYTSSHQAQRAGGKGALEHRLTHAEYATKDSPEGTLPVRNIRVTLERSPDHPNGWIISEINGEVSTQGLRHMVQHYISRGFEIVDSKVDMPAEMRKAIDEFKPEIKVEGTGDKTVVDRVIRDIEQGAEGIKEVAKELGGKDADVLVGETIEKVKKEVFTEAELQESRSKQQAFERQQALEILGRASEAEKAETGFHRTDYLIATKQIKLEGEHEFSSISEIKVPTKAEIDANGGEGWFIATHSSRRADLKMFDFKAQELLHVGDDRQASRRLDNDFLYRVLVRVDNPLRIGLESEADAMESVRDITSYMVRHKYFNRQDEIDIRDSDNPAALLRHKVMNLGIDAIVYKNTVEDAETGIRDSVLLMNPNAVKILGVTRNKLTEDGDPILNFTSELANAKALKGASTASMNLGLVRGSNRYHHFFDMPELVALTVAVMDGKYPEVVRSLGDGVRGMATTREGEKLDATIRLTAEIFKDPDLAKAVLAHELGHIVDYISAEGKHTMARGNILGRIASLKGHLKKYYKGSPAGRNPLTKEEIKIMRKKAKAFVEAEAKEIAEIPQVKELGITPQQIKDMFTGAMKRADADPQVYEFIQKASRELKKEITRAAMRGQIHPEIQKVLDKGEAEGTPKPELKDKINAKFKELFEAEVYKRRLLSQDVVHKELYELSKEWRPFDEASATPAFLKYRHSSPEIFADFISALLVNPVWARGKAPNTYEGFMNWLSAHPKFMENWYKIQDQIAVSGEANKQLRLRVREGQRKGSEKRLELFFEENQNSIGKDGWLYAVFDKFNAINRDVNLIGAENFKSHENPRFKIEEFLYERSLAEGYLSDLEANILKVGRKHNIQAADFGEYMFYKRVAMGDRQALANPEGVTVARAVQLMAQMEAKTPIIKDLAAEFWMNRSAWLMERLKESEMFDPILEEKILNNKEYATFDVVEYLDTRYGSGSGARIIGQIGTLKAVDNTMSATVMKDLVLMRAIMRNRAINATIKMYENQATAHPDMFKFEKAETMARIGPTGKAYQEPMPPRGEKAKTMELITVMRKGKIHGFYVDKWVAKAFEADPFEANIIWRGMNNLNSYFREVYTISNPGFMLYNAVRDFFRTVRNLPNRNWKDNIPLLKGLSYTSEWAKGGKDSWQRFFGIPNKVITEMRHENSLISIAEPYGEATSTTAMERQVATYHQSRRSWKHKVQHPVRLMIDGIRTFGQLIETQNKAGAHRWLKKNYPEMTKEQRAHLIRTQMGSPAFLRKGAAFMTYNNLFLFSNAMKEGWRGDIESMMRDPVTGKPSNKRFAEWWWHVTSHNFAPKVMMFMAAQGLLGLTRDEREANATIMNMVSEYVKTNYIVIPYKLITVPSETGELVTKAIVITVPQDESARFMTGILWKMMNNSPLAKPATRTGDFGTGLASYSAGQLPSLSPVFETGQALIEYYSDINHFDMFRQQHAVDPDVWDAGGDFRRDAFWDYLWRMAGGTIIQKENPFVEHYTLEALDEYGEGSSNDKILQMIKDTNEYPFMENILGRFVKVVDSRDVPHSLTSERYTEEYAEISQHLDRAVIKMVTGRGNELTDEEVTALSTKDGEKQLDLARQKLRVYGSSKWMGEYRAANTELKREYVIKAAHNLFEATGDKNAKQFLEAVIQKGKKDILNSFERSGAYPKFPVAPNKGNTQ